MKIIHETSKKKVLKEELKKDTDIEFVTISIKKKKKFSESNMSCLIYIMIKIKGIIIYK